MFQIKVKINLLSKIVFWVLGTVSPVPLSIWMVWETMPTLSHYLEMTVIWGKLTVALSLVFQDVQGLIHYSLGSSWDKAESHPQQASFPYVPSPLCRTAGIGKQMHRNRNCPEPHRGWMQPWASLRGRKDFEEAWETHKTLLCFYRGNNSQHTESSNLHASLPITNNPLPYDQ